MIHRVKDYKESSFSFLFCFLDEEISVKECGIHVFSVDAESFTVTPVCCTVSFRSDEDNRSCGPNIIQPSSVIQEDSTIEFDEPSSSIGRKPVRRASAEDKFPPFSNKELAKLVHKGLKRKGDLEFEMQLAMAICATSFGTHEIGAGSLDASIPKRWKRIQKDGESGRGAKDVTRRFGSFLIIPVFFRCPLLKCLPTLFLDIACFGYDAQQGSYYGDMADCALSNLVDKCLLTPSVGIPTYKKFEMHDLLREMGRTIVRQESDNPGERSRLWKADDVCPALENNLVEGVDTSLCIERCDNPPC
ncbi:Tir-nbs-lrr resistance protein [Corchorus capsularis]|uniref:Tir-nbs-lrr resistance protein n=1 Tax=Corchorus capsularis TaxID=210143 RepID=A0A1R3GBH7_COCAP|nr:Tir-nbs-lrr resistance protein [Corchorus capsularis]